MQHPEQDLRRTVTILNRKYSRFMIPALLSAVGVSLSEFADSLIVSRLLSADSFAIINLGAPIVLMTAMVYSMTGLGGALLYAEYLAKKEKEKADRYYTCSMLAALVLGLLLLAVFTAFRGSLGPLFGCPAELRADFDGYVQYLCWFIPAGILLMNYTFFLPIVGKPVFSMVLVISANVLNIALDVVLLRFAGMGCEGAAAATLISYTTVLAAGMLAGRLRKVPLSLCRTGLTRKYFREIAAKGFPSGIVQAGYAVTTVFCNNTLNASFGLAGVMAMSLFGKSAEFAEKYLRQGTKILVTGRIQTGSYTNRDGQKVYTTDVVVEDQEFAESKAVAERNGSVGINAGPSAQARPSAPLPNEASAGDGFMNIPEGINEELPWD